MDLLIPSSPGGLPTLSLTTNSSWFPLGEGCHASHQPSDASTPGLTVTHDNSCYYQQCCNKTQVYGTKVKQIKGYTLASQYRIYEIFSIYK